MDGVEFGCCLAAGACGGCGVRGMGCSVSVFQSLISRTREQKERGLGAEPSRSQRGGPISVAADDRSIDFGWVGCTRGLFVLAWVDPSVGLSALLLAPASATVPSLQQPEQQRSTSSRDFVAQAKCRLDRIRLRAASSRRPGGFNRAGQGMGRSRKGAARSGVAGGGRY